jgi:hypothetical protein
MSPFVLPWKQKLFGGISSNNDWQQDWNFQRIPCDIKWVAVTRFVISANARLPS